MSSGASESRERLLIFPSLFIQMCLLIHLFDVRLKVCDDCKSEFSAKTGFPDVL